MLTRLLEILRESLELVVGGVVFLDTAVGYTETDIDTYSDKSTDLGAQVEKTKMEEQSQHKDGQQKDGKETLETSGIIHMLRPFSSESTRSSDDKHKASKVIAISAAKIASWDPQSEVLDAKTLKSLINSYPKGNVWYFDEEGYFSSVCAHLLSFQSHLGEPRASNRFLKLLQSSEFGCLYPSWLSFS